MTLETLSEPHHAAEAVSQHPAQAAGGDPPAVAGGHTVPSLRGLLQVRVKSTEKTSRQA